MCDHTYSIVCKLEEDKSSTWYVGSPLWLRNLNHDVVTPKQTQTRCTVFLDQEFRITLQYSPLYLEDRRMMNGDYGHAGARFERWMAMELVIFVAQQFGIKEYFSG